MITLPALTRARAVRAALRLCTGIWIATNAGAALPQPATTLAGDRSTGAPVEAVLAGRFDGGAPVYRLPAVTVTARRSAPALEAAATKRTAREPQATQARDARARS